MSKLDEAVKVLDWDVSKHDPSQRRRLVEETVLLFSENADRYSAAQMRLFDEIFERLILQIDDELRIVLAQALAPLKAAPRESVESLASCQNIEVAGPLLSISVVLSDDFLIECAQTQGQAHLREISRRQTVGCRVSDVLVERGDHDVLRTLSGNDGAAFSQAGYVRCVEKAKASKDILKILWGRRDITRQQTVLLFSKASEAVRCEMEAEAGEKSDQIRMAVEVARRKIQQSSLEVSEHYARARRLVQQHLARSTLTEKCIAGFASDGHFEELVVALSARSAMSESEIEQMLVEEPGDRLLVVLKALQLSWETAEQVILGTSVGSLASARLDQLRLLYLTISAPAAARTVRVYVLREKARGRGGQPFKGLRTDAAISNSVAIGSAHRARLNA